MTASTHRFSLYVLLVNIIMYIISFVKDDGLIQKNSLLLCHTKNSFYWLSISFCYKAFLQIFAIFMAFHTRNVDVKVLNESKEIAAIIYINSIILVLIAVAELALESNHDAYAALFGLGLLIEATLFLGFIFIPKVNEIQHVHVKIKLFFFS